MGTQQDCSIGFSLETTYGTIVVPTKFVEFTDEDLDWDPTFTQGKGMRVGSRVDRAARRGLGKQMVSGSTTVEACSKGLGALIQAALGAVTTTQRGATGVYQQVHTPATTDYLPSWTIQKGIPPIGGGATLPHTFPGAVCGQLDIACTNSDIVTLKNAWNAREVNTAQAYAAPSYPTNVELFEFVEMAVVIGGTVTPPTATALATGGTTVGTIRDFNLTWNNNLDDGGFNAGGAGKRMRKPVVGDAGLSGSMTAEFQDTVLRDAYLQQLDLAILVTLIGTSFIGTPATDHPALQIYVPDVRLEGELPKSAGGGAITQSVNWTGLDNLAASPLTIVYASTDTAP